MCSLVLSTAIYLVPDTCWAFCLVLSIQVWTKVNTASALRKLTLWEGCEQKYSYRSDVFLKRKLLYMHLWGIWPVCGLRKSFPEGGWPEFWSNGELTGQRRGAFCAERTAHSAAGGSMAAHGDAWCLEALNIRARKDMWGRKGLAPYTHTDYLDCPHFPVTMLKWGRDSSPHILVISIFRRICSWRMIRTKVWRALQGYLTQVVLKAGTDCLPLSQFGSRPSSWFCRRGPFNKFLFYFSYYCWHYCVAKAKNPDKVGARSFQIFQVIYESDS